MSCKVFACSCHGFFGQVKKKLMPELWKMAKEEQTDRHKNWKKEREKRHTHTLTKWVIQTRETDTEKYEREEMEKRDSPKLFICYINFEL